MNWFKEKRFMQGSALVTLGTQIGIQLIGLATGILVARYLGPGGRGELAAVLAWVSMLVYAGNLGLPVAYTYASAREPNRTTQLLANGLIALFIQWPLLMLIGWVVLKLGLSNQPDQIRHLAFLYLLAYTPLNLLTLYINAIQQGLGKYNHFNAVRICVPVSYVIGLLVLVFLRQMTVGGVLFANLFSNVVTLVLALILITPQAKERCENKVRIFNLAALWQDMRYAFSAYLGTLQPFNGLRIDQLLLTVLLSVQDLGLYMAAMAGASLIRAQGYALGTVVMPEVAKRLDRKTQLKVLEQFAAFALLLGISSAVIASVWAKPLIELVYGKAFTGAASTLQLLVIASVPASLYRVLADGLRGMGHPISGTAAELISLAIGVPSVLLLARSNGADGAAIGVGLSSLGALVVTIQALLHVRKSPVQSRDFQTQEPTDKLPIAANKTGRPS
ncbi:MAG: oligosaccharide flippase family protein [Firmicutes bacterium]|nr:oligosaccharide flippase family protein [Bacillota bacterium]